MNFCVRFLCALLPLCTFLRSEEYYEGTNTFRSYGKVDLNWMVQFLPYNPIIVEAGAYTGDQVLYAARVWPNSKLIVAFEPNPRAFNSLEQAVANAGLTNVKTVNLALADFDGDASLFLNQGFNGSDPQYECQSSLLPPTPETALSCSGFVVDTSCTTLDHWCASNGVDQIDILRLELEGMELRALQGAQNILKNVKIIIVQSFFSPTRIGMPNYFTLKAFLVGSGFVPLAHWYNPYGRGTAVYISQELFDAYFVRCLGLGLGGLLYP